MPPPSPVFTERYGMLGEIATEVVVILILLVINGVFSMSELAVMTAKRTRLEHLVEETGDAGARAALGLRPTPIPFSPRCRWASRWSACWPAPLVGWVFLKCWQSSSRA